MCSALNQNGQTLRPGRRVGVWRDPERAQHVPWAGFARSERLAWWTRQGWDPVDIPATTFAERSDRTRHLTWDTLPAGTVIRGLVGGPADAPLLKVVTRPATPEETVRFEHPRMPLLEAPLHRIDPPPPEPETSSQLSLWPPSA
jgi:hypothetical protein